MSFQYCKKVFNVFGDHAVDLCPLRFRQIYGHNLICNVLTYYFCASDSICRFEAPLFISRADFCPADFLYKPTYPSHLLEELHIT